MSFHLSILYLVRRVSGCVFRTLKTYYENTKHVLSVETGVNMKSH